MAKRNDLGTREAELLEKLLLVQLHIAGASQTQIARFMGKSNNWVNAQRRLLPKRGT